MEEPQQLVDESATPQEAMELQESANEEEQSTTVPFDPAYETRRQRIFDHRVEAQADSNTLTACLAGVNSDLLDCELNVGETLRQGMATGGVSFDEIERHSRLIDLMVRLSKQIAQITQLELRTRTDSVEPAPPKPR